MSSTRLRQSTLLTFCSLRALTLAVLNLFDVLVQSSDVDDPSSGELEPNLEQAHSLATRSSLALSLLTQLTGLGALWDEVRLVSRRS